MSEQLELALETPEPVTETVEVWEWKVVGTQENFTVLGQGSDHKIYYWKDKIWNLL